MNDHDHQLQHSTLLYQIVQQWILWFLQAPHWRCCWWRGGKCQMIWRTEVGSVLVERVPVFSRGGGEGGEESGGEVAAGKKVEEGGEEKGGEEDWWRVGGGGGGGCRRARKRDGANLFLQLPASKKGCQAGPRLQAGCWWGPENLLGTLNLLLHSIQKLSPLSHLDGALKSARR